jgi:hypothetical protein
MPNGRIGQLLTLLAAFFVTSGTWAGDTTGAFALRGAGLTKCEVFVKAYREKDEMLYVFFGWIDGYVSGLNELSENTYDRMPWQSTELLGEVVRRSCEGRPTEYFFAELRSVVEALKDHSVAENQEKKVLEMGKERALVYADTLKRAQAALTAKGHYSGDAHGNFDPDTHAAIIKFQTAKGIPTTGLPGPITLWALLVER